MNRGGRPIDSVWQNFYKIERNGKTCAKCKLCGEVRSNRAERMKNHIQQCSKNMTSGVKEDEKEEENGSPSNVPKKNNIESFIVKTNSNSSHKLDLLIGKFFYANNIPFNVAEHQTFLELISTLRPGYIPPSRKALSGPLLDEVVQEIEEATRSVLTGKTVTLIEDGWSNIHNDPIISTCIHSNGKAYFLNAVDCGSNKKNANYHTEIIQDAITTAKSKYNCEVKAIVTDNAKVMEKTRESLEEVNENFLTYGCSSHLINLLGQEVTPDTVIKHVVKVQKFFRNHHIPAGLLREEQDSVKPQLPGDTRWNSQLHCVESFLRNRPYFQKIVENNENEITKDIAQLINDYHLYKQCKDLLIQLKPLSLGLDILQKDTATLADSCEVWSNLLKETTLEPYRELIKQRMDQALKPFHFLAYLMHPVYKGRNLTSQQAEIARNWAEAQIPGCLHLMIAFQAEETPFPVSYFKAKNQNLNAYVWWKGISKCDYFTEDSIGNRFSNLILQLLSCPASSASIERIFSNFGHIHSKLRNRLGTEKCAKLVTCYRMLRNSDPDY